MSATEPTLGEEVIAWIEAECRVPEGVLIGQPMQLMDWQKREILRIYDNPATTRRAIISVGRKSGKTTFAACLLLVHLVGPAVPRVICSLYSAPPDADPFDLQTIKRANPALGNFQNPEEVLAMANDAKRMPAREAAFRNLVLNQRIEASSPFVMPAQWRACNGEPLDLRGRDVFAGLDLSETRDLTALVLIGSDIRDGTWSAQCTFWLPGQDLAAKAQSDRVPYDSWHAKGFLETTPGSSVSYEYIARHLRKVFDQHRVVKIAFDRWNYAHLKPWLLNAGFSEQVITEKFIPFGQGYKSMSPALRDLESIILEKKLRHGDHPVLKMCASNAVIDRDPAGNRKLSKKRSTGRIDGMTALVMAFGVAPMRTAVQFDVEALIA